MSELKRDELLEWLDKCWSLYKTSQDEWGLQGQARKQIEMLIKKPQPKVVTEEWIEGKAMELAMKVNLPQRNIYMSNRFKQIKDFIRSLTKE